MHINLSPGMGTWYSFGSKGITFFQMTWWYPCLDPASVKLIYSKISVTWRILQSKNLFLGKAFENQIKKIEDTAEKQVKS